MTAQDATQRLQHALVMDTAGRFVFCCRKAFVLIKLHGKSRVRFGVRDKVVFRTDGDYFTIEDGGSGQVKHRFHWEQIECIAAGEPETDNRTLFQG